MSKFIALPSGDDIDTVDDFLFASTSPNEVVAYDTEEDAIEEARDLIANYGCDKVLVFRAVKMVENNVIVKAA